MMNNGNIRITVLMVLVLGLLLAATIAAAGRDEHAIKISTDGDGDDIVVAVSKALARSAVEGLIGSELSCDGATDGQFLEMLQTLDRKGRGSRAHVQTDDSVIRARRRSSTLKLDVRSLDDTGRIQIVMPWIVAECLLGRDVTLDTSVRNIKVKIEGSGGGKFEFKID